MGKELSKIAKEKISAMKSENSANPEIDLYILLFHIKLEVFFFNYELFLLATNEKKIPHGKKIYYFQHS